MKSPYSEILLRHAKHPVGWGIPANSTHTWEARNRSCGDVVKVGVVLADGNISEIGHEAEGCLLCRASASIMCEELAKKSTSEISTITQKAFQLCDFSAEMPEISGAADLVALAEVRQFPTRSRCMKLAWEGVEKQLLGK
jgi:nitrogen fixation protein NifU and related proteins